ncbi:kinase-like protein [Pseudovirgaria hyperparasitica]|uniref:Kinase-like protein n=1 Tax=Pseudovirgaria hyperparasitica TaxID=470096 RepID=A0A6A6WKC1_9PEZI|nr:kinase-like protein [Pseudovirgaria hyperparasitica]KAF2762608.1 kinase-like protein [Pseudovirgaria hyperparasitica]
MFSELLHRVWLQMPSTLRLWTYRKLCKLGKYLYGQANQFGGSQRLPCGLFMKFGHIERGPDFENEFRALQLVRSNTSIPVPRPIDLIKTSDESYFVMTTMPGQQLGEVFDNLGGSEKCCITAQIADFVRQVRSIRNPYLIEAGWLLCNALGRGLIDIRLRDHDGGPFASEAAFNDALVPAAASSLRHIDGHEVYFAHGDLTHTNILCKNGKISAVIDWEFAGWWPEYWDYTTVHRYERHEGWLNIMRGAFKKVTDLKKPYLKEIYIEEACQEYDEIW